MTLHVPLPLHPAPVQPANVDPAVAPAVNTTTVFCARVSVQSTPQVMPVPVTVPVPAPDLVTVNRNVGATTISNCAFTVCAAFIVTLHVPVPLHPAPVQPANVDPAVAPAVNTTTVFCARVSVQSTPQVMPVPVTVPVPAPDLVTVNKNVGTTTTSNCAFTVCAALIVTLHVPVPLHPAPVQPANVDPATGAAVNTTTVFCASVSLQSAPQLMPVPATLPLPVPLLVTVNTNSGTAATLVRSNSCVIGISLEVSYTIAPT